MLRIHPLQSSSARIDEQPSHRGETSIPGNSNATQPTEKRAFRLWCFNTRLTVVVLCTGTARAAETYPGLELRRFVVGRLTSHNFSK
mmetsp:Transcript_21406/g.52640  ORF Transcript_21406/g.52640 Transcript_21406/m.52640 type:complete len:87 (-) Transcript_21406:1046-1306(-)